MNQTTLGGTLIRHEKDDWRWVSGVAEPRVTDLSPSSVYNFRCRTFGSGTTYVEVLLRDCHRERDVLGWVLDGIEAGKYRQEWSGDHTGPLMITEDGPTRMHIEPGEDPLKGNEPIIRKRAIPRVALVPVNEWDAWAADNPYGCQWDKVHEDDILAEARRLGWKG